MTGILPVANGGTNSSTALTGSKVMVSNAGATAVVEGMSSNTAKSNNTFVMRDGSGNIAGALGTFDQLSVLTGGSLGLNGATSGTVSLVAPTAPTSYTFTLPTTAGTGGYVLSTNGSGVTSWINPPTGALSGLTAATGTNTIDNLDFSQVWNWSTNTTQSPISLSANALTTGSLLNLTSSSASLNSTNGLLNVANTGASTTGMVARIQSNSTAGSGLTVLANGNVGVGTASPTTTLDVNGNITSNGGQGGSERFGAGATVSGTAATAIGNGASAAIWGTAIGYGASVALNNGVAIGKGSSAAGTSSISIGTLSSSSDISIGANATGSGISLGGGSSSATYGVAIGGGTSVTSNNGVAVGYLSTSAGNAISIGAGNTAGSSSLAIGNNLTTAANSMTIGWAGAGRIYGDSAGNVGIGTTTPNAKLQIAGQVVSSTYNNGSAMAFDMANGNNQYTSASCGAMTMTNVVDGAAYTIAVQGATAGTCTFTSSGYTYRFSPANGATTASTHTIYSMQVMGTNIYVTWISGF